MKVLKEEGIQGETTTIVEGAVQELIQKESNPKFVVEAVAVQLGLKPSMCQHLWPHYIAMVRQLPLVPCVRCGAASEADMVVDVEGPTFLINRTRSVNREVSMAFKKAREYVGAASYTKESELMIFNGFCEACLAEIEGSLPPAIRLAVPEDPDISVAKALVAKAFRQGHAYEVVKALRRIVDPPTGSTL